MAVSELKRLARPARQRAAEATNEVEPRLITEDVRNTRSVIRWGMLLLIVGFGGFIAWAMLAPLDEGVPAQGTVTVDTKRKTVQNLAGGIVREILVREAQIVKAGDVLMRLDDTTAKATYVAARQQYFALRAQESRLEAEQKGAAEIRFHPDLLAAKDDPVAASYMNLQRQSFVSRRTALQGSQEVLTQSLNAMRDSLPGLRVQLEGKQAQLKLMREQLEGTRELAKDGYLPRNRWFDEERLAADLAGSVGELTANIARTQGSIAEFEVRIVQSKREFMRDVDSQLADTTRDALVASERLRAAREELARTEIRAPADGMVIGLAAHTVGGVIAPGARIMDVVPTDALLTLEAHVEPRLIDRIQAGLPADIRIHAFLDKPYLVLDGRVLSVSADLMTPDQPNQPNQASSPYYLARIAVTPAGMKELGNHQLQPGMQADIVIKTGERTLMKYLLKPLIARVTSALREY